MKILGVDEVGRGPLAGPVFSAAVLLGPDTETGDIKDSKKLSKLQRVKVYRHLISTCHYSIGMASVEEIERFNILRATLLSMRRAIRGITEPYEEIIVDGIYSPFNKRQHIRPIIQADAKHKCAAAASIIAKVERDNFMCSLSDRFPRYDWEQNKGYGTKKHIAGIKQFGITVHHRKKFCAGYLPF